MSITQKTANIMSNLRDTVSLLINRDQPSFKIGPEHTTVVEIGKNNLGRKKIKVADVNSKYFCFEVISLFTSIYLVCT